MQNMTNTTLNGIHHIYQTADALEQDAASRETSEEIMVAIAERSADTDELNHIWENGTDAEAIQERAWQLAAEDEDELYWGEETISR